MRTTSETLGTLLGRFCLALIFLLSAVGKIKEPAGTETKMKKWMQAPESIVQVADGAITPLLLGVDRRRNGRRFDAAGRLACSHCRRCC